MVTFLVIICALFNLDPRSENSCLICNFFKTSVKIWKTNFFFGFGNHGYNSNKKKETISFTN